MTIPALPHILIVAIDDDRCEGLDAEHTAHDDTCLGYEIECPGVTDACRTWVSCTPCRDLDKHSATASKLERTGEAHGAEHRYFDDVGWCTPTEQCFAAANDNLDEAAADLQLDPGRYPVTVSFEEFQYLELVLIEKGA